MIWELWHIYHLYLYMYLLIKSDIVTSFIPTGLCILVMVGDFDFSRKYVIIEYLVLQPFHFKPGVLFFTTLCQMLCFICHIQVLIAINASP